jgi:Sulfotransferase family
MAMAPVGLIQEELLDKAFAAHRAEEQAKDLSALVARKLEDLRYYEVGAMERAVAICSWGRSGSVLLASYFDGHDDVVMLPLNRGSLIYQFLDRYPSLALRDKLLAYPVYFSLPGDDFFGGQFPIAPAEYYAAVEALCEAYGNWPPQYLLSRKAFFQFLHVAYTLAVGRRPANPHPLMVYAQHNWDATLAAYFVQDFPQARFIHTVRDPVTTLDRSFEGWFASGRDLFTLEFERNASFRHNIAALSSTTAVVSIYTLFAKDRAHPGMEWRTLGIRFEDLHNNAAETLTRLVAWLDLRYQSSLLESTFNGRPYIVERDGKVWSGPRPEQTVRSRRNISFMDQALLFAVLNENFVAWNYPCPKGFRHALLRILVFVAVFLKPMKIEIIVARAVLKLRVLPSLRRGNFGYAAGNVLRLVGSRLAIMSLLGGELCRRLVVGKKVLKTQIV